MGDDNVKCPHCGSIHIHAEKRGWNIWTGFVASGNILITCLKCAHKFKPGEGATDHAVFQDTSLPRFLVAGRSKAGKEDTVIVHASDTTTAFTIASRLGIEQATKIERMP